MQVNTGGMRNALASSSQADIKKRSKEAPEPQTMMKSSNRPTSGLIPSRVRIRIFSRLILASQK
jgi:hypothetical protein